MYSTVYELIFPDGSRYVGITKNLKTRIAQHRLNPSNSLLRDKVEKYGKDGFDVGIIEKDIHDAVAYFLEIYEMSITEEDKRLNMNGITNPLLLDHIKDGLKENYKKEIEESRKESVGLIKSLMTKLSGSRPLYKDGDSLIFDDLMSECKKALKQLNDKGY